jgi:hypothetical protein
MTRFRMTAEKAGTRITTTADSLADLDHVDQRTRPCSIAEYFKLGHANTPFYCNTAFVWYNAHIRLSDTQDAIADSDDDTHSNARQKKKLKPGPRVRRDGLDRPPGIDQGQIIDLSAGHPKVPDWKQALRFVHQDIFKS